MTATASRPAPPRPPALPAGLGEPRPRFPMLGVTIRQHRNGLAWGPVLLGLTAVVLMVTGVVLHRNLDTLPRAYWAQSTGGPAYPWNQVHDVMYPWRTWNSLMREAWAVVTVSLGAALVCTDIADGTAPFAWTQGRPRSRWLAGKLLAAATVLAPAAAAFGLLYSWWFGALAHSVGSWSGFALYPLALAGWTVAGLALGGLAGAVVGRQFYAVVAGLAGYWGLNQLVTRLRPHYLPLAAGAARPAELVVSRRASVAFFQPADRFWLFQGLECLLLLAVSGLLVLATSRVMGGRPPLSRLRPLTVSLLSRRTVRLRAVRRPRIAPVMASWRQHRTAMLLVAAVLAAGVTVLLVTGLQLHGQLARPYYQGHPARVAALADRRTGGPVSLLTLLPFAGGILLGAPLVAREFRRYTVAFAWTQGVTARRWLGSQVAGIGGVLAVAALILGLLYWWWAAPLAGLGFAWSDFAVYPVAIVGWSLLSFSLAVWISVYSRSPGGAMILSVLAMLVLTYASELGRDYLIPAATRLARAPGVFATPPRSGDMMNVHTVVVGGRRFEQVVYQPLSHFWLLQGVEGAIMLALAGLIIALAIRGVGRSTQASPVPPAPEQIAGVPAA